MKRCIVADDSAVIRKVARRILEQQAFEVQDAADGRDVVTACSTAMPDAILLDWSLPDQDSLDVMRAIRAMPQGDKPKIIYCMLDFDPVQANRARQIGATDIMMKPFDKATLVGKMRDSGLH
jgi:two-component system, chemotaxis family, chemotaxis protein CheY